MANPQPVPAGHHRITTHIVVENASEALDFYKKAFGAEEICRAATPDGKKLMHAEMRIGDSIVYVADDFPEWGGKPRNPKALGGSPVTIHQYVEDCDALYEQAVAAGATPKMPLADMFWGDRYGVVVDPYGHEWSIGTHIKDMTPEEMTKAAEAMFAGGPPCGDA